MFFTDITSELLFINKLNRLICLQGLRHSDIANVCCLLLDPETGPQALPMLFLLTLLLLLFLGLFDQIFKVLRLCRFSIDRYETFHTYQ